LTIKTRRLDIELNGKLIKKDFEVPEFWNDTSALIMAEKYATNEENSALSVIDRVTNRITEWGIKDSYFNKEKEKTGLEVADKFLFNLKDILINQRAAFNSPVWFNVGVKNQPEQISACFLGDIEDTMEDILDHVKRAGMIFKSGSGIGLNISKLRAKGEVLSNKGKSSGPLSFMRMWDRSAASIKSGGKNRRSAVFLGLNADHPDIEEFVHCKSKEEDKARLLISQGISTEEAYATVDFQNANHSVILTDEFLEVVTQNKDWNLINRGNKETSKTLKAKDLFNQITTQAHKTGDPGVVFINEANRHNSLANRGNILSCNVCGEVFLPPWGACNLCSLNLVKYLNSDYSINYLKLSSDIDILITAMDIMIDNAYYPTEKFKKEAIETRPLGLGITNLGAYLIYKGVAYNSEEGRQAAVEIMGEISHCAIKSSINLAKKVSPFLAFNENKKPCINHYRYILRHITSNTENILNEIEEFGIRNSNLTCLPPTGTVALLLGADSYGIEPIFALNAIKKLSGGGELHLVPECVSKKLEELEGAPLDHSYFSENPENYLSYVTNKEIFLVANEIDWRDHIKMVAALQQVICMAASKTINMPNSATVEDVKEAYMMAWKLGLKGITIYRDGSKGQQPLTDATKTKKPEVEEELKWMAVRKKLDTTCESIRHRFNIGGFEGYFHIGLYDDGSPGEIFIQASKNGSSLQGSLDSYATLFSLSLQYGVPLEKLIEKFKNQQFEPRGFTDNENIRSCTSIVDYLARWLEQEFIDQEEEIPTSSVAPPLTSNKMSLDGPPCPECGSLTVRVGTCHTCVTCGATTGCS
jgi:ribonucleoside-diphosphate reductase alpha chain